VNAIQLPANAALGRPGTIILVQGIQVLTANQVIVGGVSIPLTNAEAQFIRQQLTLLNPP
jgi:hypothetical protein